MTDRNFILTRAVLTSKKTALHNRPIFMNHWEIPYWISNYILTDNKPSLSLSSSSCYTHLRTKNLTAMEFHKRMHWQARRFTNTIIAQPRKYVSEHQKDWAVYVQTLRYAFYAEVHSLMSLTIFSLVLYCYPQGLQLPKIQRLNQLTSMRLYLRTVWAQVSYTQWRECHRTLIGERERCNDNVKRPWSKCLQCACFVYHQTLCLKQSTASFNLCGR